MKAIEPILRKYTNIIVKANKAFPILKAELSLYQFLKQAWPAIEGEVPFVDSWHLQAIAEHLEACYKRQIKFLLINVPPRSSKTSLVSVAFPIWCWLQDPSLKFLFASYAKSLSLEHALKSRRLIESEWFQNNWSNKFQLTSDQNTKGFFENNHKGYRISTSVGAAITGSGGNFIICDDPNSSSHGTSAIKLEGVNNWFDQVFSTRLNDSKRDVKIIVQQRVHENDLTGHILANDHKGDVTKLILPMEYDSTRKCKTFVNNLPFFEDPRTLEGAFLIPDRFGAKEVLNFKKILGSYGYANQMQQLPSPSEGGILKKNWFKLYKEKVYPKFDHVIQSWDTAFSDKPDAAYSACVTCGIFKQNEITYILILSCWRGRVGYPELRVRAKRLHKNYLDIGGEEELTQRSKFTINTCLVEAKATGDPLIRDLRNANIKAQGYSPKGDKTSRVQQVSAYIEAGLVYYLNRTENIEFIEEMAKFPNASSRDYVDTLTQLLGYLRDNNMLKIPDDPELYETQIEFTSPYFKNKRL